MNAAPYAAASEINLGELGLSSFGGIQIPSSVGPFSYFDARVAATQTLFDWKAISAIRASRQSVKSAEYSYKDARDLVVLAVGYTYLQAIADEARIETAQAQVKTAQALYDQASDQVNAGTSPAIDGLRAKVELQTRQQQLIQAQNTFAIQKLTVARVIGLSPGQEFELTDKSLYQPFEIVTVDEALKRAYASRSDYQAAMTDVRAAEFSRKAAVAGYLPSLSAPQARIPARRRKYSTCEGLCRFRSFREAASMAMFYRPMRSLRRAANASTTCARRLMLMFAPRC